MHALHIKRGRQPHKLYDTNGLWLESINQKTSDTNGNHISDLVLLQKQRRGPILPDGILLLEKINNHFPSLLFHTTRGGRDGKHKVSDAAGEAGAGCIKHREAQALPPWPMTTGRESRLHIHSYTPRSVLFLNTHFSVKTYMQRSRSAERLADSWPTQHRQATFIRQHGTKKAVKGITSTSGVRNNK